MTAPNTSIPTVPPPTVAPLPKWVGLLGAAGVLAGALQSAFQNPSVAAVVSPHVVAAVTAICGFLVLLSHSFTGTGGANVGPNAGK